MQFSSFFKNKQILSSILFQLLKWKSKITFIENFVPLWSLKNNRLIVLGRVNYLQVVKSLDFGIYLDGGEDGEILMPTRYVPENTQPEDWMNVFIYLDSEDRLLATTERPYAQVGDFAFMKVTAVTEFGAFLDWGLPKDLMVPFREQQQKMIAGERYLVHIYEDAKTKRIAASSKIDHFIGKKEHEYEVGEEVDLLIAQETELGIKVIVDGKDWGVLYRNEVFKELPLGTKTIGYIKNIREDKKLDISLEKVGYEKVIGITEEILKILTERGGFIELSDKSEPEAIYEVFETSKKNYKKAIGDLFKRRLIMIEKDGIRLVNQA